MRLWYTLHTRNPAFSVFTTLSLTLSTQPNFTHYTATLRPSLCPTASGSRALIHRRQRHDSTQNPNPKSQEAPARGCAPLARPQPLALLITALYRSST